MATSADRQIHGSRSGQLTNQSFTVSVRGRTVGSDGPTLQGPANATFLRGAAHAFADRAVRSLTLLDSAETLGDLAALPSNRLEALRGNRAATTAETTFTSLSPNPSGPQRPSPASVTPLRFRRANS